MSNNSQPKQRVSSGYYSLDGILGLFLRQFVIFISSTSQNVKKVVGTMWKKLFLLQLDCLVFRGNEI